MGVRFDNDSLCCDSQNADRNLLDGFSDVEASGIIIAKLEEVIKYNQIIA